MIRFFFTPLLLLLATFPILSPAQEDQSVGYIMVLNLAATGQPSYITLGDLELYNGEGMAPGNSSSYLGMYAGDYPYVIRNEGAKKPELRGTITIKPNETIALVFYSNTTEKKDGTIEHELVATPVNKAAKENGARLSLVLLAQRPLARVRVKGNFYDLTRLKSVEVPVTAGQELTVKHDENSIGEVVTIDGQHVFGFISDSVDEDSAGLTLHAIELTQIDYVAPETFEEEIPAETPTTEAGATDDATPEKAEASPTE